MRRDYCGPSQASTGQDVATSCSRTHHRRPTLTEPFSALRPRRRISRPRSTAVPRRRVHLTNRRDPLLHWRAATSPSRSSCSSSVSAALRACLVCAAAITGTDNETANATITRQVRINPPRLGTLRYRRWISGARRAESDAVCNGRFTERQETSDIVSRRSVCHHAQRFDSTFTAAPLGDVADPPSPPSSLESPHRCTARRPRRNARRRPSAVAHQDRRRQHRAIEAIAGVVGWHRLRPVRGRHVRDLALRHRRRRDHRYRRRGQHLRGEIPDHQRQSMGGARSAADGVLPPSAPLPRRAQRIAHGRPDHAGHQGHRHHPGLHQLRAARHRGKPADARRHDRRDVLHQLAVHAAGALDRAGALRHRVFLHAPHQGGLARRPKERERAALRRRRHAELHPRRPGVRPRRLRGPAVRFGKPANGGSGTAGPQPESQAVADCRCDRRPGHLSGARIRSEAGAGGPNQRRRADRLPVVSREDVQADARPLEDDRHRLQSGRRLRAHPGGRADRKSRPESAGCARSLPVQRGHRIRPRQLRLRRRGSGAERRQFPDRARPGRRDCGAVRHRQVDDRQFDSALLRSPVPGRSGSTARTCASTR